MSNMEDVNRLADVHSTLEICLDPERDFFERNHFARSLLDIARVQPEAIPDEFLETLIKAYQDQNKNNPEFLQLILQILIRRWEAHEKVKFLLLSTLTQEEEKLLASEVQRNKENGETVTSFLEGALKNNFICLNMYTPQGLKEITQCLQERQNRASEETLYIALNIPEKLTNEFHAFITGDDKAGENIFRTDSSMSKEKMHQCMKLYKSLFSKLRSIPGVSLVCVGSNSYERPLMETVLDNINTINESDSAAKVCVVDMPLLRFNAPITKGPLTNSEGGKIPSLPQKIAATNPGSSCVTYKILGVNNGWCTHEETEAVRHFCDRHRIHRSFALTTPHSVLGNKLHHDHFYEPMRLTNDGIIVCINDNDDDLIILDPEPLLENSDSPSPRTPVTTLSA